MERRSPGVGGAVKKTKKGKKRSNTHTPEQNEAL
jgi:hypothetical protein